MYTCSVSLCSTSCSHMQLPPSLLVERHTTVDQPLQLLTHKSAQQAIAREDGAEDTCRRLATAGVQRHSGAPGCAHAARPPRRARPPARRARRPPRRGAGARAPCPRSPGLRSAQGHSRGGGPAGALPPRQALGGLRAGAGSACESVHARRHRCDRCQRCRCERRRASTSHGSQCTVSAISPFTPGPSVYIRV